MAAAVKPFDPAGSRYDLTTYTGRVRHFFDIVDLRNAIISDADADAARRLLAEFKAGRIARDAGRDAELWEAKKKVDSVYHPDTGEVIPRVFRMSMFMPANLPISAGMLLSGTGPAQLVFQWLNQSYNAGFNYANRNASVPLDMKELGASYLVATGTAVGAAAGLGRVVARMQARVGPRPSLGLKLLSRGLPWLAVATAGAANAVAMRYKEAV